MSNIDKRLEEMMENESKLITFKDGVERKVTRHQGEIKCK